MSGFLRNRGDVARQVRDIVEEVARRGNDAVIEFTERFDHVRLTSEELRIGPDELTAAHRGLDDALMATLRQAIANVRAYQSAIFIGGRDVPEGIRYTPLKRVGLCIPGASAPLPSTVIMTAVCAIVAGVSEIAVISPPRHNGTIHPVILAVCRELGIDEVYRIGGAHAVAALAWGTQTIAKVDKIVGPGNDYVQLAKKEVFGLVDMDSFAGPSDVLILADETANAAWVAADMLSQAEHNPGAGILVTHSQQLAQRVLGELEGQAKQLDRADATVACLKEFSAIVVVPDLQAAIDFVNNFAPEHLQIQCGDRSRNVLARIENAGAIFVGPYTPVAVGDYWAGPSHTLPTRQTTRHFSALTSNDFIKSSSIIEYDKQKLLESADDIIRLAMTEGLDAHARSVNIRRQD
ncbi:MAG: histidinol dehydrogenase [Phycisphaerae bacterium]|nr:histidinol dehydrogenase [Phycisphaerae bacterium]